MVNFLFLVLKRDALEFPILFLMIYCGYFSVLLHYNSSKKYIVVSVKYLYTLEGVVETSTMLQEIALKSYKNILVYIQLFLALIACINSYI